ncbi:hypothetical protein [Enterobacter ludwigii]|uniref:hypothetical protein n=1 Tax=Enterobacter ludwigii TaxID=299767 RepID=UPI002FD6D90E
MNINDLKLPEHGNNYVRQYLIDDPNIFYINQDDMFNSNGLFVKDGYLVPYSLDGMHISLVGATEAYKHFSQSKDYSLLVKYMHLTKD